MNAEKGQRGRGKEEKEKRWVGEGDRQRQREIYFHGERNLPNLQNLKLNDFFKFKGRVGPEDQSSGIQIEYKILLHVNYVKENGELHV